MKRRTRLTYQRQSFLQRTLPFDSTPYSDLHMQLCENLDMMRRFYLSHSINYASQYSGSWDTFAHRVVTTHG